MITSTNGDEHMKTPIKNPVLEDHALAVAKAINDEDAQKYKEAVNAAGMDAMKRWELLAFRDRVHYLAEELQK